MGGYLFLDGPPPNDTVVMHDRTTQGSYSAIRHEGKWGYEWWVLEAFDPSAPFEEDLHEFARVRARRFADPLPSLVEQTPREHLQRWEIRDRKPLKQWSKGRVTLVGDAAHPTSPYAAYGAGMSIEDGYFLAGELERIDVRDSAAVRTALQAFEDRRKPHTKPGDRAGVLHRLRVPPPAAPAATAARPRLRPHAAAAEGHRRRHARAHPQPARGDRRGGATAAGARRELSGQAGSGPIR